MLPDSNALFFARSTGYSNRMANGKSGAFLPLALCLAALLACKSSSKAEITQPKLGTLTGPVDRLQLKAEAARLPLVPSKSGDVDRNFGICFHYTEGQKLGEVAILVSPPGAIKTESVELEKEKAGDGVRMKLPALAGEGDFCQEMFFEAGDPPGKWRFELQQGATAIKRWDVDVYTP
jgi:hypothetical protein